MFHNSFSVLSGTKIAERIIDIAGARFAIAQVTLESDSQGNASARIPFASGVVVEYGVTLGTGGVAPSTPITVNVSTEKYGQTQTIVNGVSVSANTVTSTGPASTTHEVSAVTTNIPMHVCGPINISISGASANKQVTVGIMLGRMR